MEPRRQDGNETVKRRCDYQHHGGRELGLDGMVNKCELPVNVVRTTKPKMLTGLNQKVWGMVWKFSLLPSQPHWPPADRQHLPHQNGTDAERGKPVAFLGNRESQPQGKLTRLRVEEDGTSEGSAAMAGIGVAL
jgi:hypothetical protein